MRYSLPTRNERDRLIKINLQFRGEKIGSEEDCRCEIFTTMRCNNFINY